MKRPRRQGSGGALVCVVAAWWSVCRDLGGGGAGAGFVDDGLAAGVGSDERLDGQVVDGPGQAGAGGVDQGGSVVAEQRPGPAGEGQVVAYVAGRLLTGHAGHGVADGDP